MKQKHRDAYFAGLIDGEGTLYLSQPDNRPTIEVKMSCCKTIEALRLHFGGTVRSRKPGKPGWLPQWTWRVRDVQAREVVRRVRPFMITKADAADLFIAKWKASGRW